MGGLACRPDCQGQDFGQSPVWGHQLVTGCNRQLVACTAQLAAFGNQLRAIGIIPHGKGEGAGIFAHAVDIACLHLVKGAKRIAFIGAAIHAELRGRINIEF